MMKKSDNNLLQMNECHCTLFRHVVGLMFANYYFACSRAQVALVTEQGVRFASEVLDGKEAIFRNRSSRALCG